MNDKTKTDFCIEIDFEKGSSEKPSRIFNAMAGLIDSIQVLDVNLAQAIDIRIHPELILQEIEVSSLRSWLRNRILEIDDESLKKLDFKKIIGEYLVSAKHRILQRLKDKDSLRDQNIRELQQELQQLAEETDVKRISSYATVKRKALAEFWIKTSESTAVLGDRDVAKYISTSGQILLPKGYILSDEIKEEMLTHEISSSETMSTLKVKKPDYLGQSKWLFHLDGHPMEASIEDKEWLEDFQSRKIIVQPGDSLKTRLKVEIRKGYDKEDISVHYYVIKVMGVLEGGKGTQADLFSK